MASSSASTSGSGKQPPFERLVERSDSNSTSSSLKNHDDGSNETKNGEDSGSIESKHESKSILEAGGDAKAKSKPLGRVVTLHKLERCIKIVFNTEASESENENFGKIVEYVNIRRAKVIKDHPKVWDILEGYLVLIESYIVEEKDYEKPLSELRVMLEMLFDPEYEFQDIDIESIKESSRALYAKPICEYKRISQLVDPLTVRNLREVLKDAYTDNKGALDDVETIAALQEILNFEEFLDYIQNLFTNISSVKNYEPDIVASKMMEQLSQIKILIDIFFKPVFEMPIVELRRCRKLSESNKKDVPIPPYAAEFAMALDVLENDAEDDTTFAD